MVKVRNLSGIQQEISFTELDFCQRYEESFKTSELGRIKSLLLLMEMSVSFALIGDNPKSLRTERDRKAFFTPEGKVRVIARETDRSAREEAMRCSMLLRKRQQDFLQGERYRDHVHSERSRRHERVKECGQERTCQCKSHSDGRLIRHSERAFGLRKMAARLKSTEIMPLFFGIRTADVVNLARRESAQVSAVASLCSARGTGLYRSIGYIHD